MCGTVVGLMSWSEGSSEGERREMSGAVAASCD